MGDVVMPDSGEAKLVEANRARARIDLAKELEKTGVCPFSTDSNADEFEDRAKIIASSKDQAEAELSYVLWTLKESRAFLDKGYNNFQDYIENVVKIGRSKANALVTAWEMFAKLGLSMNLLGGEHRISWNKFRLLRPAFKAELINSDTVYEWIPFLQESGPGSLLGKDLEHRIKKLVGKAAADAGTTQYVKFPVSPDDVIAMYTYQETIQQGLGISEIGRIHMTALEHLATKIISGNPETVAENLEGFSLLQIKKIVEAIDPTISCVFFSDDPSSSIHNLSVVPAHLIYQGVTETNGSRELAFVLASSEEEAREILGTKEVRAFDLILGPGYQRKPSYGISDDDPIFNVEGEVSEEDKKAIQKQIRGLTKLLSDQGRLSEERYREISEGYEAKIKDGAPFVESLTEMYDFLVTLQADQPKEIAEKS